MYSAPAPSVRAMLAMALAKLPLAAPTASRDRAVSSGYTATEAVMPASTEILTESRGAAAVQWA